MGILDQDRIRGDEVDEGEDHCGCFVAVENAETGAEDGEKEELDDAAGDTVGGVDGADFVGGEAETAGKLEGEVGVGLVGNLDRIVEEDGEDLVVCYGVEGEEGV